MSPFARLLLPLVLLPSASACNNDHLQMRGTPETVPPFAGPVPETFGNVVEPAAFQVAASEESARLEAALKASPLLALTGAAPATVPVGPLPDLNRCSNLHAVMGGFLSQEDVTRLAVAPELAQLRQVACGEMLKHLGSEHSVILGGLQAQLGTFARLGLADDDCTSVTGYEKPAPAAALRYKFRPRSDAGLYLTGFDVPKLKAELDGGSDSARLAFRAESEIQSFAPDAGDGPSGLRQWAGLSTLVDVAASTLESHKGELIDLRTEKVADGLRIESLARYSIVKFSYGAMASIEEETTFSRFTNSEQVGAWKLVVKSTPRGSQALDVDVSVVKGEVVESLKIALETSAAGDVTKCGVDFL